MDSKTINFCRDDTFRRIFGDLPKNRLETSMAIIDKVTEVLSTEVVERIAFKDDHTIISCTEDNSEVNGDKNG